MPIRSIVALVVALLLLFGCRGGGDADVEIVNVSHDPTRELFREINEAFRVDYEARTGTRVRVRQSHAGSGAQARAVIDGQKADVVTLALAGDIEHIAAKGLLAPDWQRRMSHNSCPYTSTIVFVVRRGNPKAIRDWPDLVRHGVEVVTPNPRTSGGARWNFLAAWGYQTIHLRRSDAEATDFVAALYANVKTLDAGARGSGERFARRGEGDVFLSWENEAILLKKEFSKDGLEIVYPSVSILAEPPVAMVDRVVDERGTRAVAQAYLDFLYSDAGQEIIGKHGYRPARDEFRKKHAATLRPLPLFTLAEVAGSWTEAQARFFDSGGVFDRIRGR